MQFLKQFVIATTAIIAAALFSPLPVISHADAAVIVGGRPAGCPARYCGCASARHVGLSGAKWNLAANWLTLPRASCAPGMAAARRGHVFIIKACHGNGTVTAYDPNSGGGKTRIHTRSLAGYTVVNPRGGGGGGYTAYAWWKPEPHHAVSRANYRRSKATARRHAPRAMPPQPPSQVATIL